MLTRTATMMIRMAAATMIHTDMVAQERQGTTSTLTSMVAPTLILMDMEVEVKTGLRTSTVTRMKDIPITVARKRTVRLILNTDGRRTDSNVFRTHLSRSED